MGAHRRPTREIKVLVFVTQDFTARISIRDDWKPQSASKQAHRYHYIVYILLGITLFGEPSDYLMNVMQLRCDYVVDEKSGILSPGDQLELSLK